MTALRSDFLWGASTSGHQVEGNNLASDWWANENSPHSPFPDRSGDACDSYHRYREDMALLAGAGLNAYRFGIEWPRLEPVRGQFSAAERDHYRRMVQACRETGLEPVVTLHHFTVPQWFAQAGGWSAADAVDRFAEYVAFACTALEGVRWVCTINEPNMVALFTSMAQIVSQATSPEEISPLMAAATPDAAVGAVLTDAHRRAVDIVRERVGARAGWTVAQQAFEATPGNEEVFARVHQAWEGYYLQVAREDDFVGVQAYTSQPVGPDGPVPHPPSPDNTLAGWAYRPDALGIALRRARSEAGGVPLLVTENGIATDDDTRRVDYTRSALGHLHDVVDEGADVRGYLHWSALDNYEWGRWAPTFGLIAVDRRTFVRTPKPSLAWLGQVARAGGLR